MRDRQAPVLLDRRRLPHYFHLQKNTPLLTAKFISAPLLS
jgi:hypothetical protein